MTVPLLISNTCGFYQRKFIIEGEETRYNLRRGAVIFLPFAGSTKHGTNYAFSWPLIRNQLTSLVNPVNMLLNSKIKPFGNIGCGCGI